MKLAVFMVLFAALLTSYAWAECPDPPPPGESWTVADFESIWQNWLENQECCCINNVLGAWVEVQNLYFPGACDCPSIPERWFCNEEFIIKARSVTPIYDDGGLIPPPPSGGWSNSTQHTIYAYYECECRDENGKLHLPGCIVYKSGYVPVLYAPCYQCMAGQGTFN